MKQGDLVQVLIPGDEKPSICVLISQQFYGGGGGDVWWTVIRNGTAKEIHQDFMSVVSNG